MARTVSRCGVNIVLHGRCHSWSVAIYVYSHSSIEVTNRGTVTAAGSGIRAVAYGPGDVSVNQTGDVTASGGFGILVATPGSADVTGNAAIRARYDGIRALGVGAVSVTHTGDISSTNNRGIYARSDSGVDVTSQGAIMARYEGIRAFSDGGGEVTVKQTGDVTSTNGQGIYARSIGGNIAVTINGGTVTGGSGSAGVQFAQGIANTLRNYGTITTADGITGIAVQGDTGNEAITNFGTITGTVDLGTGGGSFDNRAGATYVGAWPRALPRPRPHCRRYWGPGHDRLALCRCAARLRTRLASGICSRLRQDQSRCQHGRFQRW